MWPKHPTMVRFWLLIFVSFLLMVTDHGQFWTDDLAGELFPEDQICITVSHRLAGCSLDAVVLQPAVLPLVTLCPQPRIWCYPAPVKLAESLAPPCPKLTRRCLIRPPPTQA